jgi:PleD family two-component response regulator
VPWRIVCLQSQSPSYDRETDVPSDNIRVLIVDEERALLSSLSDYLIFRGRRVDRAHGWSDARALIHHMRYDAVVIGVLSSNVDRAVAFAREARALDREMRLIAVAEELAPIADEFGNPIEFDEVLGRHLSINLLAEHLCQCIAA